MLGQQVLRLDGRRVPARRPMGRLAGLPRKAILEGDALGRQAADDLRRLHAVGCRGADAGTGTRRLAPRRAGAILCLFRLRQVRPARRAGPHRHDRARRRALDHRRTVGPKWQRIEASYTPKGEFLAVPSQVRLARRRARGKDALDRRRAIRARHVGLSLSSPGRSWRRASRRASPATSSPIRARASASGSGPSTTAKQTEALRGRLRVTDFWGRTVWEEKPDLEVGPGQGAERPYAVLAGRRGFFRIHWEPEGGLAQTLRCAVIEPCDEEDTIFGFNHAFGQDFLLPLSHQAGLRWWRDWSDQWDTVQPKRDAPFDFRMPGRADQPRAGPEGPDARAAALSQRPLGRRRCRRRSRGISTIAAPRARCRRIDERQAIVACKPARLEEFAEYVRATVKHFQGRVAHYEILNEPLYTHYALPSSTVWLRVQDVRLPRRAAHGLPGGQGGRPEMHRHRRHRLRAGQQLGRAVHRPGRPPLVRRDQLPLVSHPRNGPRRWRSPSRCAGSRCRPRRRQADLGDGVRPLRRGRSGLDPHPRGRQHDEQRHAAGRADRLGRISSSWPR